MATIDFYEKPGCIGNARQKKLLQAAGHHLRVHNLLTELWSPDTDSCLGVFPRPEKKQNRCYVILRSRIVHLN
jgi:hypothetical protein